MDQQKAPRCGGGHIFGRLSKRQRVWYNRPTGLVRLFVAES